MSLFFVSCFVPEAVKRSSKMGAAVPVKLWCGSRVVWWSCGRLSGLLWSSSGRCLGRVGRRTACCFVPLSCRSAGLGPFYGSVSALGLCGRSLGLFFCFRSALVGAHFVAAALFRHHGGQEQRISPPNPPSEPRLGHKHGHEKKKRRSGHESHEHTKK